MVVAICGTEEDATAKDGAWRMLVCCRGVAWYVGDANAKGCCVVACWEEDGCEVVFVSESSEVEWFVHLLFIGM